MTQEEAKAKFSEWYFTAMNEIGKPPLAMQIWHWLETNYLQQPIPQDINKWQEAKCWERFPEGESFNEMRRFGWNECAQLLLPELQQLREEIKELKKKLLAAEYLIPELRDALNHELEVHKEFIQQQQELQECKEQLAQTKKELDVMIGNDLRQEKEIESLKRTIFNLEANNEILIEQIESLKQENEVKDRTIERIEKQKTTLQNDHTDIRQRHDYWKQRCEAAEEIMETKGSFSFNPEIFNKWQTLKQQTHG